MRRAFTIVEVLTCLAIICIVAALSYPAMGLAKRATLESKSKTQMHELNLALLLYQGEYGGDGMFGDSHAMALPPFPYTSSLPIYGELKPPLAPHPISGEFGRTYYTLWASSERDMLTPSWATYSQSAEARSIMFVDPFNNRSDLPLVGGSYCVRKIFGIQWDGSLLVRQTAENWEERSYWLPEK
jgi:prepilin-type N-terminal cleavage/methylation domain-containing protein